MSKSKSKGAVAAVEVAPVVVAADATVPVVEMTEEAILRGDRASTITPLMWKMLMDGRVELDYSLNTPAPAKEKGVYDWCAVAPLPKVVLERSGLAGYTKSKIVIETRDPRACISCGDKSSPLQPSGECDSCLSDRLSSELTE